MEVQVVGTAFSVNEAAEPGKVTVTVTDPAGVKTSVPVAFSVGVAPHVAPADKLAPMVQFRKLKASLAVLAKRKASSFQLELSEAATVRATVVVTVRQPAKKRGGKPKLVKITVGASKPTALAAEDAAGILRHLAGQLPGVDQAEALIAAYVDAFAETSSTLCDRWAEVDRKRKDHAVATMRRALLAVGATEPARVTVGEIVECLRGGCDEERMAMADTLEATITGGGK